MGCVVQLTKAIAKHCAQLHIEKQNRHEYVLSTRSTCCEAIPATAIAHTSAVRISGAAAELHMKLLFACTCQPDIAKYVRFVLDECKLLAMAGCCSPHSVDSVQYLIKNRGAGWVYHRCQLHPDMPVTWISQLLLHHTQYIGVVALFPASHATVHDSANHKHERFSGGRFVSTPRPCISKVCNIIQSGCKTADELFNVSALGQIV